MAGHEPIKQHSDGCQMLLDRRLRHRGLQSLDIGRDMQRLDIRKLADAPLITPCEELADGV